MVSSSNQQSEKQRVKKFQERFAKLQEDQKYHINHTNDMLSRHRGKTHIKERLQALQQAKGASEHGFHTYQLHQELHLAEAGMYNSMHDKQPRSWSGTPPTPI
jgi:hypothetical protein